MTDIAPHDVMDAKAMLGILLEIVGPGNATDDPADRALCSQDIFSRAPFVAEAVVSPANLDELSRVVATATGCGRAIFPRGGGASYTGGYLASVPHAITVDLRRMNAILEINIEDMYVRVEPGVTWTALNDALREHDVRTPFWGVQSGLLSTVGGAMSQHATYYGSGVHGASAESVLSLAVVLADGSVLHTGSAAIAGTAPFNRYFGPDLAGLFLGDNGVMGIKGEITLKLMLRPTHEEFVSASFHDFETAAAAMSAIARLGVVADGFMMDPGLQAARLKRVSLAQDLESLSGVARNSGGLAKGLISAARVALAGRDIVDEHGYSIHLSIEHRYRSAVDEAVRDVAEACTRNGGRIIENSIPKIVRGNPFGPLNIVVGGDGKRWLPTHGIVPHSRAKALQADIKRVFDARSKDLQSHGIEWVLLATVVGTGSFQIDPVMTWPDEIFPLHERLIDKSYRQRLTPLLPNPAATALIVELRGELKTVFALHGATHMQIGRAYPFRARLGTANWDLLSALKTAVDPRNLMNPGALDLGVDPPVQTTAEDSPS